MTFDPHETAGIFGRAAATYDTVVPFFAGLGARLVDFACLRPGASAREIAPDDREDMRRELFAEPAARRTPAGIPMDQTAAFVVAEK